ncbi:hypothetical protein [Elstera cyanobacteriorum]|uniref:hypothetical protein n=1 Tax=Elstera cyanobacteriorum TaxID=2022747 RepID=UPI00235434BB|nr:hypothetical protein [Elstera cyanobacteriorum]MCK6441629.1 hypothetical protein [Elstera cyanobacteriorum]
MSPPPTATSVSTLSGNMIAIDPQLALFLQQMASKEFVAEDLVALARTVYVHVLLRARQSAGGHRMSRELILGLTGRVLTQMVGFYLDAADVSDLLDEADGPASGGGEEEAPSNDDPMEARRKRLAAAKQKSGG